MAKAFRHGFYWPTALQDVESLILKCEGCQRFSKHSHQPASALRTIPITWPFAVWGLDMVGLLGNIVISKNFLCTRKIMVMHSNERGECRPHTLIDRKQKRYENVVDVVVRLHDPTDPSTEHTTPPSSAHVQLGDVP